MSYKICPKCNKSREVLERVEVKDGKTWRIEYCYSCKWNFEIYEHDSTRAKRRAKKFKWGFGEDEREEDLDDN